MKHLSFGLDLSILLKTIKRVLVHDSHVEAIPTPAVAPISVNGGWADAACGRA